MEPRLKNIEISIREMDVTNMEMMKKLSSIQTKILISIIELKDTLIVGFKLFLSMFVFIYLFTIIYILGRFY